MKHIPYPPIEQSRHVIKDIKHYEGPTAKVRFTGTVKLHGANFCVIVKRGETPLPASRNNILDSSDKGYNFAQHVADNAAYYHMIAQDNLEALNLPLDCTVRIYGEWAGKGIQKKVGICKVPKSFYIFEITVEDTDGKVNTLLTYQIDLLHTEIYDIRRFKTYHLLVDLEQLQTTQDTIAKLTAEIENRCPVASYFLPSDEDLIGEGIVWKSYHNGRHYKFKSKGEKHKANKSPRTYTPEELALRSKLQKLADSLDNTERYDQALEQLFGPNYENTADVKQLGNYLKLVNQDIDKEEYDLLPTDKAERKPLMTTLQQYAKNYFFGIIKQQEIL